jgi:pimeloyl-ACP methyl ester carboxylesterase
MISEAQVKATSRSDHLIPLAASGAIPAYAEELHANASREHDAWDVLTTIRPPVLILQGSDDPVCPGENARLLAERIPEAELHIFNRGRHMFFIEFRQPVNSLILDFLARHPLSGGRLLSSYS